MHQIAAADLQPTGSNDAENVELIGRWVSGPCYAVAVRGDTAYFGNGCSLEIVDFDNPADPVELGKVLVPNVIEGVALSGDYAYVADRDAGLRVIDISTPTNPFEAGYFDTGGSEDVGEFSDYIL